MVASSNWTYTQDPATSSRDAVRFLCGDTDPDRRLLSDGEIAWTISEEANVYMAAARAAHAICAQFATLVQKSVGDLRISYNQRQDHYRALATSLETRGKEKLGGIYVSGISRDDKIAEQEDLDRVPPFARIGLHDNPGADQGDKKLRDDI